MRAKDNDTSIEGNSKKNDGRTDNKNFTLKETSSCTDREQRKTSTGKESKPASESSTTQHNRQLNNHGQNTKKHTYLPKNLKNPFQSQKTTTHRCLKNSFGQNQKQASNQVARTTLVDIQVEDCQQCAVLEMSIASLSDAPANTSKDSNDIKNVYNQSKLNKMSPTVQFKYNCTEAAESPSCKNKKQNCHNKLSIVETITKGKKSDDENRAAKSLESTKKFLWGSRSSKSINKSVEKSSKEQERTDSTEKQTKSKKIAYSPLKRFGRSSLTIEPDKIMINLSKYSPCASRLAASSKILSNDVMANPESPIHGTRSRSPSNVDVQTETSSKTSERTSMQASLSLNIQQFQKPRHPSRSRSVGDSCVTSPTSEATTLSYSPTGTEILSLEEVGPQMSSAEGSASYSEVKEKLGPEYPDKVRRATLETKC